MIPMFRRKPTMNISWIRLYTFVQIVKLLTVPLIHCVFKTFLEGQHVGVAIVMCSSCILYLLVRVLARMSRNKWFMMVQHTDIALPWSQVRKKVISVFINVKSFLISSPSRNINNRLLIANIAKIIAISFKITLGIPGIFIVHITLSI